MRQPNSFTLTWIFAGNGKQEKVYGIFNVITEEFGSAPYNLSLLKMFEIKLLKIMKIV